MNKIKITPKLPTFIKGHGNVNKGFVIHTKKMILNNITAVASDKVIPIQNSITKIKSIHDIKDIVEWPLISTIEKFFLKRIETISSSANGNNIDIALRYDTLSVENKKIAQGLGGQISCSLWSGFRPMISFTLPPKITPTQVITQRGERLANAFKEQKIIQHPSYTLEEFAALIMKVPSVSKQQFLKSQYVSVYRYDEKFNVIRLKNDML